jgi:hypothetical protein
MFRTSLAHPQKALRKGHLVYYVRIMSVACATIAVKLRSWHSSLYARNIPSAVCVAPPEDEQVMLETCRGPWFSVNLMKSASRWFHYTDNVHTWHNMETQSDTLPQVRELPVRLLTADSGDEGRATDALICLSVFRGMETTCM